ncbi:hypothetical protein D3C77_612300 [compost metagenome]
MLQFLQYKFGDNYRSFDKTRFTNIGDSSIDNDACVENFVFLELAFLPLPCASPLA